MSRIATTYLGLGTWGLAENPGAGTQDLTAIGTGLNDNWKIIDLALGLQHNTSGVHKNDIIDGPMLKTTAADGVTLELAGSPLKLRIKDAGVTLAKISSSGASAGNAIIYSGGVVAWGSPTPALADASVTNAKIADATIDSTKLNYIEAVYLVSQSGTSAPVATLISLNRGVSPPWITWARTSTGLYTMTAGSAPFTANKTVVWFGHNHHVSYNFPHLTWSWVSTSVINLRTYRGDTGALSDAVLTDTLVMIRVYP